MALAGKDWDSETWDGTQYFPMLSGHAEMAPVSLI